MAGFFQTRERRALVVFLLLAGVFVAGLLLAERRKSAVSADRVEAEMEATVAADSVRLFEFDPNTVEYADLRRLGLSSRMAVSLLKYRAAGKVFRIPEDVATCYGMTDSVYFILEPYIRIGREYALTPSPRREYREYVPQDADMPVIDVNARIGRASCRERLFRAASISVAAVSLKKVSMPTWYLPVHRQPAT